MVCTTAHSPRDGIWQPASPALFVDGLDDVLKRRSKVFRLARIHIVVFEKIEMWNWPLAGLVIRTTQAGSPSHALRI